MRVSRAAWLAMPLGVVALLTMAPGALASSHREAPLTSMDPTADHTDVYAFIHPSAPGKVNLVACFIPFEDPAGGPNFYRLDDTAYYDINVDNNGDALPDITFRFQFRSEVKNPETFLYNTGPITSLDDPDYNFRQYYTVSVLRPNANRHYGARQNQKMQVLGRDLPVPPCNIGPKSTPDYEDVAMSAVRTVGSGIRVFVGQRDDPFFVDVASIFDLLTLRPFPAPIGTSSAGKDSPTAGMNVHAICMEVPVSYLTRNNSTPTTITDPNAVIGVWSAVSRASVPVDPFRRSRGTQPTLRQVSRLDLPLVNEVLIPLGKKDLWNASEPKDDGQFLEYVTDPELARLLTAVHGVPVPPAPRNDLVTIALTGIPGLNQPPHVKPASELRLNVAVPPTTTPNRLGILAGDTQGFPNGRRLTDDVVDIMLRVIAGATPFTPDFNHSPNNLLTDGVDANDVPFKTTFPYLASPHQGLDHTHGH